MYFGNRKILEYGQLVEALSARYPSTVIVGCSTGGQILDDDVTDDTAVTVAVAVEFASTRVELSVQHIATSADSQACGRAIGQDLQGPGLAGIFIRSDGLSVNGSELTAGVITEIGADKPLSGGLAGDGSMFERTLVGANAAPQANRVAAIGFYGPKLRMRTGSGGGWNEFGPRRTITHSVGNVLHELDGQPARCSTCAPQSQSYSAVDNIGDTRRFEE